MIMCSCVLVYLSMVYTGWLEGFARTNVLL